MQSIDRNIYESLFEICESNIIAANGKLPINKETFLNTVAVEPDIVDLKPLWCADDASFGYLAPLLLLRRAPDSALELRWKALSMNMKSPENRKQFISEIIKGDEFKSRRCSLQNDIYSLNRKKNNKKSFLKKAVRKVSHFSFFRKSMLAISTLLRINYHLSFMRENIGALQRIMEEQNAVLSKRVEELSRDLELEKKTVRQLENEIKMLQEKK